MSEFKNTSLQPPSGARMEWDAMKDKPKSELDPAGWASKRFARLLHLYAFPNLSDDWGGLWETQSVEALDTPQPEWSLVLVVAWNKCQPLGTRTNRIPEWFINEYGRHVERAALRGEQAPNPTGSSKGR